MSEPTNKAMRTSMRAKICRDTGSKEGWSCSLQDEHVGDHVAFANHEHNDVILEQWSADSKLPAKARPSSTTVTGHGVYSVTDTQVVEATKATPESEDESFERECKAYGLNDSHSFLKDTAKHFWNARVRLDAERGRTDNE